MCLKTPSPPPLPPPPPPPEAAPEALKSPEAATAPAAGVDPRKLKGRNSLKIDLAGGASNGTGLSIGS